MNGPEAFSESGSINPSEEDETRASRADFVKPSTEGEAPPPNKPTTGSESLALKPSPYGSPFAYVSYQNKHDFFKGLLIESTRLLFDQVVAEASSLRYRLLQDYGLISDGSRGHFCKLENFESSDLKSELFKESNSNKPKTDLYAFEAETEKLTLRLDDSVDPIGSDDSSSSTSQSFAPVRVFDVCRVWNPETAEFEYFVEKQGSKFFSINGIRVNSSSRVGPLPNFAVFELESFSMFWWRTISDLEYMPVSRLKRKSEDQPSYEAKKRSKKTLRKEQNSLSCEIFPERNQLVTDYHRRLFECEGRSPRRMPGITQMPPHQLLDDVNLLDEDVVLAIAAVWCGLNPEGSKFSFGHPNLFSIAQFKRLLGFRAVPEYQPFIIPLHLSMDPPDLTPESEDNVEEDPEPGLPFTAFQRGEERKNCKNVEIAKQANAKDPGCKDRPAPSLDVLQAERQKFAGGIGHFVLAVAELRPDGRVQITIRDSLSLKQNEPYIRRAARNVVRFSGLLRDEWPQFAPEVWESVTAQSCGNTCGYHAILNAWAYMLNLPLAIPKEPYPLLFYQEAKLITQCALRGQLDGQTIKAFMQANGYIQSCNLVQSQQNQLQCPEPSNLLHRVRSVAMNESILSDIIDQMVQKQEREKPKAAPETVETGSATQGLLQESGNLNGKSSRSSTKTPLAAPISWQDHLDRGLAIWNSLRRSKRRNQGKDPVQIASVSGMAAEEVVLAIACIWEALNRSTEKRKQAGQTVLFEEYAYAGCDILAPTGTGGFQISGAGVVGVQKPFIIPMLDLSKEHFFLAIVEVAGLRLNKKQERGPFPVRLQILDSRPGTVSRHRMWAQTMSFIDSSGWVGGRRLSPWPDCELKAVNFTQVPHQVGIDACGFFVILNAWALMLGITIRDGPTRRGRTDDHRFLAQGLEIVNLALAGFMDSRTIHAFLAVYGYCYADHHDSPDPSSTSTIPSINAVGMNHEKLSRVMRRRRDAEILQDARAGRDDFLDDFSDAVYAECQQLGLERDNAWKALVLNGGDWQKAVNWLYNQPPSPSSALSPRTPEEEWGRDR